MTNSPRNPSVKTNIGQVLALIDSAELIDKATCTKLSGQVASLEEDAEGFVRKLVKAGLLTQFQAVGVYQLKTAGLRLGPYLLLDRLGAGGVGAVYKARHLQRSEIVAVKVLNPAALRSSEHVRRFRREAEAALRLTHPNIVRALEVGDAGSRHYLVMEWIDGTDLSSLVKRFGPLPCIDAVNYTIQVANALSYAHGEGIVHRDVKPGNILLTRDKQIKLLDLGLARLSDPSSDATAAAQEALTQTGQVLGTIDYMAPEQALQTKLADERADIYSLGCTLYRIVTGENPYGGESVVEKVLAHREHPIPSLRAKAYDVPPAVDVVFRKMLAKRPDWRQQSMDEVVSDLRRSLASPTVEPLMPAGVGALPQGIAKGVAIPAQQGFPVQGIPVAPVAKPVGKFQGYSLELTPPALRPPWMSYAVVVLLAGLGASGAVIWKKFLAPPVAAQAPVHERAEELAPELAAKSSPKQPVNYSPRVVPTPSLSEVSVPTKEPISSVISSPPQLPTAGSVVPRELPKSSGSTASNSLPPSNVVAPTQTAGPSTAAGTLAAARAPTASTTAPPTLAPPAPAVDQPAPVTVAPPAVVAIERREVPDATTLKEADKLVRELYATEFASAKTESMQASLARFLFDRAIALSDDAAGRYAMLRSSRDLALVGGDVAHATKSAETAAAYYKVDSVDWLAEGVSTAKLAAMSVEASQKMVSVFLARVDDAAQSGRWTAAKTFVDAAVVTARKIQDTDIIRGANERSKQLDKEKQQWDVMQSARVTLEKNPADPAANLVLGKYLCFVQGKWEEGFSHLARGNEPVLKELGQKSLVAPADFDGVVALGDLWWTRAERASTVAQRRELQCGAAYWYQRVAHQLSGLLKSKIDKRIAEAAPQEKSESAQYLIVPLSSDVKLAMRSISPGRYVMGSPETETPRNSDETQHPVVITRPFFLAVTEMTQSQWRAVMGSRIRDFTDDPQFPVHSLSVASIDSCLQAMNSGAFAGFLRFRLPTEAEWEYAARAGTTTPYYWGYDLGVLSRHANPNRALQRVAQHHPNPWGLFDITGNVAEICADAYASYPTALTVDPFVPPNSVPSTARMFVVRGRDPGTGYATHRLASRARVSPAVSGQTTGFRLACDVFGRIPPAMLTRVPLIAAPSTTSTNITSGTPAAASVPVVLLPDMPTIGIENTPAANLALANWVRERGGSSTIQIDQRTISIAKGGDIPTEAFTVIGVYLSSNPNMTAVADADVAHVARHAWLRSFGSSASMQDDQLKMIARIPELRVVNLSGSPGVTDIGLSSLAQAKYLSNIAIEGGSIQGKGIAALAGLESLAVLSLPGNESLAFEAAHIGKLRSLTHLILSKTSIDDSVLSHVATLTELESLYLSETKISDAGLAYLTKLKRLKSLYLNTCQITTIAPLAECTELRTLSLSRTKIDGRIADTLPLLAELSNLYLDETAVGDSILPALQKLEKLDDVWAHRTKITKSAVATFRLRRPKVSLEID